MGGCPAAGSCKLAAAATHSPSLGTSRTCCKAVCMPSCVCMRQGAARPRRSQAPEPAPPRCGTPAAALTPAPPAPAPRPAAAPARPKPGPQAAPKPQTGPARPQREARCVSTPEGGGIGGQFSGLLSQTCMHVCVRAQVRTWGLGRRVKCRARCGRDAGGLVQRSGCSCCYKVRLSSGRWPHTLTSAQGPAPASRSGSPAHTAAAAAAAAARGARRQH